MYVCMYVSGTGAEKVTKQTREKDGNTVFESIIRDIEWPGTCALHIFPTADALHWCRSWSPALNDRYNSKRPTSSGSPTQSQANKTMQSFGFFWSLLYFTWGWARIGTPWVYKRTGNVYKAKVFVNVMFWYHEWTATTVCVRLLVFSVDLYFAFSEVGCGGPSLNLWGGYFLIYL
jgi:hypothetical protein